MKKFYLFVITMMISVAMNAQITHETTITESGGISVIPNVFTYNNNTYIAVAKDNGITIYNEDIELFRQIDLNLPVLQNSYEKQEKQSTGWVTTSEENYRKINYIQSVGYYDNRFDEQDEGLIATQTLFNDDEKFEFVTASYKLVDEVYYLDEEGFSVENETDHRIIYHSWQVDGVKVISEDGVTLFSIPMEFKTDDYIDLNILQIKNKVYLMTEDYNGSDDITYYNFYKLDKQSSSISYIKSIEASPSKRFSIDGRCLEEPERGINILRMSDGTTRKVLVK